MAFFPQAKQGLQINVHNSTTHVIKERQIRTSHQIDIIDIFLTVSVTRVIQKMYRW